MVRPGSRLAGLGYLAGWLVHGLRCLFGWSTMSCKSQGSVELGQGARAGDVVLLLFLT